MKGRRIRIRPGVCLWLGAVISVCFCLIFLVPHPTLGQVPAGPARSKDSVVEPKVSPVALTEEERAWLKQHPVIRVVQDPGWPPVEFVDNRGEPTGISNDYLNLVQERLGITFELVRHLSWQEAYARLKRWDIDMTTSVAVTPERATFWAFTKPYLEIPIVILTHADVTYVADMGQLSGKKVAVVDGYAVNDWIPRDFPDITLVKVRDVREGLELLQQEQVFAFIDNMLVIGYYLSKLKIANLKIAGETPYINAQAMAVRKDWSMLAGILQKGLDSISEEDRARIYQKWVPIRYDHGFNYRRLWQILAIFAVILAALLFWNRKLANEIRQRRIVEQALGKSEQRFRKLFNVAPVPLGYVRRDGVVADVNERFSQTFGYTLDEVSTMEKWSKRAFPDHDYRQWAIQNWHDTLARLYKDEAGLSAEVYLVTCKNGEVRPMVISVALVDEAVLTAFFDITDIRRAEQALRDSELKYRELVESAGVVVLTFDTRGRVTFINDYARRLFGFSDDELVGRELVGTIVPDADSAGRDLADMIDKICQSPEGFPENENENITKSGHRVWVRWNNRPIYDPTGALIGILAIGTDITERKQAEQDKEKLQIQLAHAQKMEAVGTLAGGIAHDFNNLLQAVNGYTQLILLDKTDQDQDYNNLMAIQQAGLRAADLVRELLLFSRKADSKREQVDLNQELKQAKQLLQRTIPKMVAIEIRPEAGLWTILADPIQVEQMLLNLGSNAADAMPGGGRLILETENATLGEDHGLEHLGLKSGRYVLLTTSDTGHGIDPETMEHIFDPFFTTKALGKGTGLGLASVYGIVKSHGGHITCYSEVGQGTTFKIYLPAAEPEANDQAAIPTATRPVGGTETILLVDDEDMVRALAQKTLEKFGYTVLAAASGEEALTIYFSRSGQLDLVIMDLGMPGMGGYKCFQEIMGHDPTARVLIASGYAASGQVDEALAAGAAGYVGKPYQVTELLGKVRAILDSAK